MTQMAKGLMLLRQGDVLLQSVESAPSGRVIPRIAGAIVLAAGESTGHHHQVLDKEAELLETDAHERFLRVLAVGGVRLTHEEHDAILLPRGNYRVILQREYTPQEIRRVTD